MFELVKSDNLAEKTIKKIDELINKGILKPGDKLPSERDLARQMGISRGILREALKSLESLGYLIRKPGYGTCIREVVNHHNLILELSEKIKYATYMDLFEAREMLEQRIVELAIERATVEELAEIRQCVTKTENSSMSFELIYQFHLKLAMSTKNIILINFMVANYELVKNLAIVTSHDDYQRETTMLAEHEAILDAIIEKDVEKAKQAVHDHLNSAMKSIRNKYK